MTATARDDTRPTPPAPPRLAPHAPDLSALLRALGHHGRLALLDHLRGGGKTVRELQDLLGASQPVVSSHLARLRHEGLVRFERDGKCSVYYLVDGPLRALLDHLDTAFCDGLRPHAGAPDRPRAARA